MSVTKHALSWLHHILPKWIKHIIGFKKSNSITYLKKIALFAIFIVIKEFIPIWFGFDDDANDGDGDEDTGSEFYMNTRNLKMSSLDPTLDVSKEKINLGHKYIQHLHSQTQEQIIFFPHLIKSSLTST